MEVFLSKEIAARAKSQAAKMLLDGKSWARGSLQTDTQYGPAFWLAREPKDLLVLGTFKSDDVEFFLGVRPSMTKRD